MYGQGRLTPFTLKTLQDCGLDAVLAGLPSVIQPPALKVLEAYAQTPIEATRAVFLGQDPFPTGAIGLAFSKARGEPVKDSLANIFACLRRSGYNVGATPHCDLLYWAKQGVLLVNVALTMGVKSGDHMSRWRDFTRKVIGVMAARPNPPVFIALGDAASTVCKGVTGTATVLRWGHPSPMSTVNADHSDPRAFIHADVFTRCADLVSQERRIDWGLCPRSTFIDRPSTVPEECPEEPDTLWLFTDGAATANGKKTCRASWAFHATDGVVCHEGSGECAPVDLPGKEFMSSNQRGELMGVLKGLEHCLYEAVNQTLPYATRLVVVTDSMYCVNLLSGGQRAACNVDLISWALDIIGRLQRLLPITFVHQKAHPTKKTMMGLTGQALFLCMHNDRVDKLAAAVLA